MQVQRKDKKAGRNERLESIERFSIFVRSQRRVEKTAIYVDICDTFE